MESLKYLFESFMMLFAHEFNLWGYNISFLQIFIFGCIVSIVGTFIYNILN